MSSGLFTDLADARRFQRRLLLWLDAAAAADQPVYPSNLILAHLLDLHGPVLTRQDGPWCRPCGVAYPCRTTVSTAVTAQFPIRWSGVDLAAHLAQIDPTYSWNSETQRLWMAGDPELCFTGRPDGGWDGETSERGSVTRRWEPISDEKMVEVVLGWFAVQGYPYYSAVDPEDVDWVRSRLAEGRQRWASRPLGASHQDRRVRWRGVPSFDPLQRFGWGPLQDAVLDDDPDAARQAVDGGANPEQLDEEGNLPLHLCAEFASIRVARYLIEELGVEVDAPAGGGKLTPLGDAVAAVTPLYRAVFAAAHTPAADELVMLLVRHGADPDWQRSNSGETPRAMAERLAGNARHHFRDVRALLSGAGDSPTFGT